MKRKELSKKVIAYKFIYLLYLYFILVVTFCLVAGKQYKKKKKAEPLLFVDTQKL